MPHILHIGAFMPDEAKPILKTIAGWAAAATVLGILVQVLVGAFYFGARIEKKADRVSLEEVRQELANELREHNGIFADHRTEQALLEGALTVKIDNIQEDVGEIKALLHEHNNGGP